MYRVFLSLLVNLLLCLCLSAVAPSFQAIAQDGSPSGVPAPAPARIVLVPSGEKTVQLGGVFQVVPLVYDSTGAVINNPEIEYYPNALQTSIYPTCVTVSRDGMVTATAVGTCGVTVMAVRRNVLTGQIETIITPDAPLTVNVVPSAPEPTPTPLPSPSPSPTPTPTPTPNAAPTVNLTSPTEGATFAAPANITITAIASDSDGTVAKVEFFQASIKLGEDTTAPFSYAWSNVAAGTYMLTAKATDNAGATAMSSSVSTTVNSNSTDFSLSASPNSRNIRRSAQTNFTVTVTPSGGFTENVTFGVSSVLPAGVSVSFSPQSVNTSGSSTMTVSTSSNTPLGTYVLTITGTSGSLQRTKSVTLNVRK